MNVEKSNKYIITYSNNLEFEGVKLAFRKGLLFDISSIPTYIPFNEKANCWIVKRKQLSFKKAEDLTIKLPVKVDVSNLQWYQQIQLS